MLVLNPVLSDSKILAFNPKTTLPLTWPSKAYGRKHDVKKKGLVRQWAPLVTPVSLVLFSHQLLRLPLGGQTMGV